jgi:carotenoid 1,2-hydratase
MTPTTKVMERIMGLVRNLDELKCTDSNPMYLYSDPSDDIRHPKSEAGAYEWWYFDALDPISGYGVVAILYDGLLFSPDYHDAVRSQSRDTADHHPGFSLSIYNGIRTDFYSLASYPKEVVHFGASNIPVQIGANRVEVVDSIDKLIFKLHLDETLPSGLRAYGVLRFESKKTASRSDSGDNKSKHRWNLVQPNAIVTGDIHLQSGNEITVCTFNTRGYHDHNIGLRPLEHDFDDWYWGRIHIGSDTLVWYITRTSGDVHPTAWLFEDGTVDFARKVTMQPAGDASRSIFGLSKVPAWSVEVKGNTYLIVEDHVWDNGPFYQRYRVKLVDTNNQAVVESIPGIAEYIVPSRIAASWVKPMIRIRHHHAGKQGNWIQSTPLLSRLTW